jgi:hypothetical protein
MKHENKIFLKECALYVRGDISRVCLHGNKKVIKLFSEVLNCSREFYVALQNNDTDSIIPLLKRKREASRRLKEQTGYVWPL